MMRNDGTNTDKKSPAEVSTLPAECTAILRIAAPMAVANLVERAAFWVSWSLVGRLGPDFLGPVTLASSVNNVFGMSITIGLSIAVSTLASQAVGAGDDRALGLVLQRAIPINALFCVPVLVLLVALEPILLWLEMDATFARRAGRYGLALLPTPVLTGCLRAMQSWLTSQSITRPMFVISLAMLPLHAALSYVLVYRTRLGYLGAGVAMSLAMAARTALLYAYICRSPRCQVAFRGFTAEAFSGWWAYLALALPGVAMLSEYWVGEGLLFAAAKLPRPGAVLSALAIYQLGNTTCYQLPGALRIAVSTRVGSALGAAQPASAQSSLRAGFLLVLCWIPAPAIVFLEFTRGWASIFTTSAEVVAELQALAPWLVAYVSCDALLAVSNGALSGSGQQRAGGHLALLSYVGLSLPGSLALSFYFKLGAAGLMSGHALGKFVHSSGSLWLVMRTHWGEQSRKAIERVQQLRSTSSGAAAGQSRQVDNSHDNSNDAIELIPCDDVSLPLREMQETDPSAKHPADLEDEEETDESAMLPLLR